MSTGTAVFTDEEKALAKRLLDKHEKLGTPLADLLKDYVIKDEPSLAVEPDEVLDPEGKVVTVKKVKKMGLLYMIFGPILNIFNLMPRMCDKAQQKRCDSIGVKATFISLPFAAAAGYLAYYLAGMWIVTKWIMVVVTVAASILSGIIIFYIIRGLYEYISTNGQGVGDRA